MAGGVSQAKEDFFGDPCNSSVETIGGITILGSSCCCVRVRVRVGCFCAMVVRERHVEDTTGGGTIGVGCCGF